MINRHKIVVTSVIKFQKVFFTLSLLCFHASYNVILLFLSLDQEVMQDSKLNSVNGNPFMEASIQWLSFCFVFFSQFKKKKNFVVKVARYNTALARFRDNHASYTDV